jgi:hypothetical protein
LPRRLTDEFFPNIDSRPDPERRDLRNARLAHDPEKLTDFSDKMMRKGKNKATKIAST